MEGLATIQNSVKFIAYGMICQQLALEIALHQPTHLELRIYFKYYWFCATF